VVYEQHNQEIRVARQHIVIKTRSSLHGEKLGTALTLKKLSGDDHSDNRCQG
jgi:hypothetical protein